MGSGSHVAKLINLQLMILFSKRGDNARKMNGFRVTAREG